MKIPFILLITLSASYSMACNQKLYDQAYAEIIKHSLTTPITCERSITRYQKPNCLPESNPLCYFEAPGCKTNETEILKERRDLINTLRDLCNGQRSRWEVLGKL